MENIVDIVVMEIRKMLEFQDEDDDVCRALVSNILNTQLVTEKVRFN